MEKICGGRVGWGLIWSELRRGGRERWDYVNRAARTWRGRPRDVVYVSGR